MLLKKLESFFLLLVLGFFVFSCDVDNPNQTPTLVNPTPTNNVVSIELLGVDKIKKSRFVFMGKLDENPINIPEDSAGSGFQRIELGATGKLEISVNAYSIETGELTATGSGSQEISTSETSFEIQLKLANPVDGFYLTFNNEGEETKFLYYKDEFVDKLPAPKKDGYLFNGWFTMANGDGTKLESNSHKMTADLTVYAYWVATNPDTKYTVTFETNGGSAVAEQIVTAGDVINAPAEPTKTDYIFAGWYFDSSYNTLASFPYSVTNHVTLYAKWVKKSDIVKVTGVTLDKASLSFVSANMSQKLSAIIAPANATNKSVTWTSSNPGVATVSNGTVTALAAGSAIITVTTADGGFTETCSVTVASVNPTKTLSALILKEASSTVSTKTAPAFTVTGKYTDRTTEDVTSKVTWNSTDTAVATVSGGTATLVAAGKTDVTATYDNIVSNKATITVSATGGDIDKLFFMPSKTWGEASPRYAAYFFGNGDTWVSMTEHSSGVYVCEKQAGFPSVIFCRMNPGATQNAWGNKWNQTGDLTIPTDKDTYRYGEGAWDNGDGEWIADLTGTYSGGAVTAEVTVEAPIIPEVPTVTISPANGEISLKDSIVITYEENNAPVNAASVTISGAVSKTYSLPDFLSSKKSLSISLDVLGLKANDTITVSASATNSEGTTSAGPVTLKAIDAPAPSKDTFTWDNVNAYFVLTDRFANGDSANDHSYSRKNGLSGDENVATFHGGDIKGLTQNMDYFKKLGINAIWITAPYEQAHGWVSGKDKKFPHYAFHGYYTLDWTFMDKNMGTIDEFRAFVQACHENGIRVIMDVVMNHVGYNNTQDMITYGHGKTSHGDGWLEKVGGVWEANDTVVWDHNLWGTWWGPWARSFAYENTGSEYGGSCGGLPDIRSEVSDTNIGIAPVLKIKWEKENNSSYDKWRVPAVANVDWWNKSGNWRQNQTARIVEYQAVWLSAWVREFGIDGFRCDTAKHVEPQYWGMLKDACTDALKKWRADPSKVDNSGAKNWDENFWMTGECWGWTAIGGGGEYYNQGKFDSMINFNFNGGNNWDGNYRQGYPKQDSWNSYININKNGDSDGNGHRDNVLSYISSHDTGLTRVGDQYEVGTGLVLLPGGVQIYYGDESYREKAYAGCGDGDMMTRGDMNLSQAKTSALTAHWGKVGNFRKFNPAVGAGTGSGTKRTYNGTAGESKVAIGISGSSVDVSGLFADGTTVYNWYDGKSASVSGGKVTFAGGSMKQPILVSDRNPADYGVTF